MARKTRHEECCSWFDESDLLECVRVARESEDPESIDLAEEAIRRLVHEEATRDF